MLFVSPPPAVLADRLAVARAQPALLVARQLYRPRWPAHCSAVPACRVLDRVAGGVVLALMVAAIGWAHWPAHVPH
ncbi:hypothetical protein [Ralstonia solanacearum]|uniref:hypothetical protein n=1 Tax=Ralstonia solanacearum TaxID=305 RepID=UPI0011AE8DAB|nr:hypothetical protein [Ralstonia solanacearum]